MKLQNIAVLFAIIIIPVTLLLSAFIQNQIDTLALQSSYDTKLMDSAYDAVLAFQINNINNKESNNTDSTRRDVLASIQTFTTTLATNLGVEGYSSKYILPYVPAMVFTLNDGYYIYTPTNNNGKIEHILKPYVYYTARYKRSNIDVVINYSLDSYLMIYGTINGEYITKSGYLINPEAWDGKNYYGVEIGTETSLVETVYLEELGITEECRYIYVDGNTGNGRTKLYQRPNGTYFTFQNNKMKQVSEPTNGMVDTSAIEYYNKAKEFTLWVQSNLGTLRTTDIVDLNNEYKKSFSYQNQEIFSNINADNDPDDINSLISQHKRDIMRMSLEMNIRYAIDDYSNRSQSLGVTYNFSMPKLLDSDWDKILSDISFICFLQGMPVGNKIYNSYVVINSTQNKQYINPNNIYYTVGNTYHKLTCKELIQQVNENPNLEITGYNNIDYRINSYQIGDTDNKVVNYYYKKPELQDYTCIVNSRVSELNIFSVVPHNLLSEEYNISNKKEDGSEEQIELLPEILRKAYYKALARERYNTYRLTDFISQ